MARGGKRRADNSQNGRGGDDSSAMLRCGRAPLPLKAKCAGARPPTAGVARPSAAPQLAPPPWRLVQPAPPPYPPPPPRRCIGVPQVQQAPSPAEQPRLDRSRSPKRAHISTWWRAGSGSSQPKVAAPCGDECFWASPAQPLSWTEPCGEDDALFGGASIVEFHAALIVPGAEAPPAGDGEGLERVASPAGAAPEGLPIAFFFPGLGMRAEDAIVGGYRDWAAVATEPFILVAAERQPGRWWFIDDDTPWGWLSGDFRPETVRLTSAWIDDLSTRQGIDPGRVAIFGFSAGAYAVAELLASGRLPELSGVGIGGVHGHGQAHVDTLSAKRSEGVIDKFLAFVHRLSGHSGARWIEATHADSDQCSRWEDAAPILAVIDERQRELSLPGVAVRVLDAGEHDSAPGSKRNRSHHDYTCAAFLRKEFFVALFGGEASEPKPLPPGMALAPPDLDELRARAALAILEVGLPNDPPSAPIDVPTCSVSCDSEDWEARAYALFEDQGFVIVDDLLKLHQVAAVLRDCERIGKEIVGVERRGNRGPGRYSFGTASSTGSMLHVASFARHLLDGAGATLRPLLDRIFDGGVQPGFMVYAGGGDFVLGDVRTQQELHSDIHIGLSLNRGLPPPMVSVNFCVQDITEMNGAMRIVPGTQTIGGIKGAYDPRALESFRLCPVNAGAAIIRDVRVLHSGTPNLTPKPRYLPSVEYISMDLRATNRRDMFPLRKGLPWKLYERLSPEVQELCKDLVVEEGKALRVAYWRR